MVGASIINDVSHEEVAHTTLGDLLERSSRDGFKFLRSVFTFLNEETDFFKDPEASKQLARLLKLVKQGAQTSKPTPPVGPPTPQPQVNPAFSGNTPTCRTLHLPAHPHRQ